MKQEVTVQDLERLASEARESVWAQAGQYDREPKIYLHWSAGHYNQTSDHYHVNAYPNIPVAVFVPALALMGVTLTRLALPSQMLTHTTVAYGRAPG